MVWGQMVKRGADFPVESVVEIDIEDPGCAGQPASCWVVRPVAGAVLLALTIPFYLLTVVPMVVSVILRLVALACNLLDPVPALPPRQKNRPRIYFDGAGHSFGFMLGVARHLVATYDLSSAQVFAASAGNLAAILLILESDPSAVVRDQFPGFLEAILRDPLCQPLGGYCKQLDSARALLDRWLPHDIHVLASGRLHVLINSWPHLGLRCSPPCTLNPAIYALHPAPYTLHPAPRRRRRRRRGKRMTEPP
jgi:hypothetical protein